MSGKITKQQAEVEIAAARAEEKRLDGLVQEWDKRRYQECNDEIQRQTKKIWAKYARRYDKICAARRRNRAEANEATTALRIKYASVLWGIPTDAVMVEWIHDWEGWRPTGRTGKAEVYLDGSEWPRAEDRPQIGAVIVRVNGKTGRPTKQACRLEKVARDTSFRKYCWLPKGKRPAVEVKAKG